MSDKLLHERLREAVTDDVYDFVCGGTEIAFLWEDEALALADEIERQYIPLPRFPDGESVCIGCAVYGGIVDGWCVWNDGAFQLNDEEGNVIQDGDPGDFAKRPDTNALDVDGVETKVGDTVWLHDKVDGGPVGELMKVVEVLCDGTLVFEGGGAMPARLVTHREPDSFEKLMDDLEEYVELVEVSAPDGIDGDALRCAANLIAASAARLKALMERGA